MVPAEAALFVLGIAFNLVADGGWRSRKGFCFPILAVFRFASDTTRASAPVFFVAGLATNFGTDSVVAAT